MKAHAKDWLANMGAERLARAYATFTDGSYTRESDAEVARQLGPAARMDGVVLTPDTLAKARAAFGLKAKASARPRPAPSLSEVPAHADTELLRQPELPGLESSRAEWAMVSQQKKTNALLVEILAILVPKSVDEVAEPLRAVGGER